MRKISISDFVSRETRGDNEVTLIIDSVIQNPGNYAIPGELRFNLLNTADGPIDSGTFKILENVYTAGLIDNFYVTPLDTTAGKSPVTYQFTVIP